MREEEEEMRERETDRQRELMEYSAKLFINMKRRRKERVSRQYSPNPLYKCEKKKETERELADDTAQTPL